MIEKNRSFYWLLAVLLIFCLGIFTQANILLNFDVSWLMRASQKLLNGGRYYTDFIETNPPLILYFYISPVLMAKLFHVGFAIPLKLYIFAWAAISVFICGFLLKDIFADGDGRSRNILLLTIAFVYVLLPGYSFGEREHIALILTLPYLLVIVSRLGNKIPGRYLLLLIGVMAGTGFALKPYFLFVLVFIEFYLMFKRRDFFSWIRLETSALIFFIIIYVISIFLITPEYIYKVWPLVYRLYFIGAKESWSLVLSQSAIVFYLITLGFIVLLYDKIRHKNLINVLMLAATGFLCSYLIQRTPWYYHVFPALALTSILIVLLLCEYIANINLQKSATKWKGFILVACIGAVIMLFPVLSTYSHIKAGVVIKNNVHTDPLLNFAKKNARGGPIYVFTIQILMNSTLVDYAKVPSASRLPSLLFMPGLDRLINLPQKSKVASERFMKEKQEVIDIVVDDLSKNPPSLMFVDEGKKNPSSDEKRFDYLQFFSQDKRFKEIFVHYTYVKTLGDFAIYARKL
jgi:hypothetical protein